MGDYGGQAIFNSDLDSWQRFSKVVTTIDDFNGDGFSDYLVTSPYAANDFTRIDDDGNDVQSRGRGVSYVVFGTADGPATFDLADLDGTNGFSIGSSNYVGEGVYSTRDPVTDYETTWQNWGSNAAALGDVNGDGLADFAISGNSGHRYGDGYYVGTALYIVFGTDDARPAHIDLADLSDDEGFSIGGLRGLLTEVEAAGDINNDGLNDFMLTAAEGWYYGESLFASALSDDDRPVLGYVILGDDGLDSIGGFDVNDLDGTNGFTILGGDGEHGAGRYREYGYGESDSEISTEISTTIATELTAIGDINGDGFDDLHVRTTKSTSETQADYSETGYGDDAYHWRIEQSTEVQTTEVIIFGDDSDSPETVMVDSDSASGNVQQVNWVGSVSDSSSSTTYYSPYWEGQGWVGVPVRHLTGAGDFNGDGFDDVALGHPSLSNWGPAEDMFEPLNGLVMVVFGDEDGVSDSDGMPTSITPDTADMRIWDSSQQLWDDDTEGWSGRLVSEFGQVAVQAGDVDGDGQDDLLIAARGHSGTVDDAFADSLGLLAYVVFGRDAGDAQVDLDLSEDADGLDGNGYLFHGIEPHSDFSRISDDQTNFTQWLNPAGDVNGDGFADFVIGSDVTQYSAGYEYVAGRAFLVHGGTDALEAADKADGTDDNIINLENVDVDVDTGRAPIKVWMHTDSFSRDEGDQDELSSLSFQVRRDGDLTQSVTVSYAVEGLDTVSGGSADGDDFLGNALPSGSVTFVEGEDTAWIQIDVTGDIDVEQDEGLRVRLTEVTVPDGYTGALIGRADAIGVIRNDDLPSKVSVSPANATEGDGTDLVFRVSRQYDLQSEVTVDYVVSAYSYSGVSSGDVDGGLPQSGTVTFAPGEDEVFVSLGVVDDNLDEDAEYLEIRLSNAQGDGIYGAPVLADSHAYGYIYDDDDSARLQVVGRRVVEDAGTLDFTVTRTGDLNSQVTVDWTIPDGGSVNSDDIDGTLPLSGTLTFAADERVKTVSVGIIDDRMAENSETLELALSNAVATGGSGLTTIVTASAIGTIDDNDQPIRVYTGSASGIEGDGTMGFTINRSGNNMAPFSVGYSIELYPHSQSASDADLDSALPITGTVQFAQGETSKSFFIGIADDDLVEGTEYLQWRLTSASSTVEDVTFNISSGYRYAAIYDNDYPVNLSISGNNVAEGGGAPLVFTLTRSGRTDVAAQATYEFFQYQNQPEASDFVNGFPAGGVVTFAAGETVKRISLDIADDAIAESNEYLGMRITDINAGGVPVTGEGRSAYAGIINDDLNVELSVDTVSGSETGGPITVTIRRSGDTSAAVDADYQISAGAYASAASQADVQEAVPMTGTVSFAAGETVKTIQITPIDDDLVEADEFLEVTLTDARSDEDVTIVRQTGPSYVRIVSEDRNVEISVSGEARNEDDGQLRAFITRSGRTDVEVTVEYRAESYDVSDDDVSETLPVTGSVTFAAGETSKVITLHPVADDIIEQNEYLQVTLTDSYLSGADADDGAVVIRQTFPAYLQIVNDDHPVRFWTSSARTDEGGSLGYAVYRSGRTDVAASVDWVLDGGSVESGDITGGIPQSGKLSFAAGESVKYLNFGTVDDSIVEGTENARLNLSNPAAADGKQAEVTGGDGWGYVYDNDFNIVLRVANTYAYEDSGALRFLLTRSGEYNADVTVSYQFDGAGWNPASADDVTGGLPQGGSVYFAAGETSKVISLGIVSDNLVEGSENVSLTLTGATTTTSHGIDLQSWSSIGSILNDDYNIDLGVNGYNANEGDAMTYVLTRTGATNTEVTVDYSFAGAGRDPASSDDVTGGLPQSGQVTFAAGETHKYLAVNTVEDDDIENSEGLSLTIDNASTTSDREITGIGASRMAYINNDDFPVVFSAYGISGYEDTGVLTFVVTRSGHTATAATVEYSLLGNMAGYASADDVRGGLPQSGTISFAEGETSKSITLVPIADSEIENAELVQFTLSDPTAEDGRATQLSQVSTRAYIYNDDLAPSISVSGGGSFTEGNSGTQPVPFTFTRTGDLTDALKVDYALSGTADSQDVTVSIPGSGSLSFAAGESSKTVLIGIQGDRFIEPHENFSLTITGLTSSDLRSYEIRSGVVVTRILNDDGRPPIIPPGVEADVFGDPHIVTLDGLTYDFMAVGEYILVESMPDARDPFQVQVRFEPAPGSDLVSVTTRAAVQVNGHVVELDALSDSPLLIDGVPTVIDPALGAIDIDGDETSDVFLMQEDGMSKYVIVLNDSNEQLMVGMAEGYMNVCVFLAEDRVGGVRGLMGNADGSIANDIALRDGTELGTEPDFDQLYGDFAASWRLDASEAEGSDKASLFTYADGVTTADYYDPEFPAAVISLDDVPADLLARAEAAADAVGLTDPILREAAILDYIFTGDPSFVTGATGLAAEPVETLTVAVEDDDQMTSHVAAVTTELTEGDAGASAAQFRFYRTGDTETAITIAYTLAGTADADDLSGDAVLSGSIVIAEGSAEALLDLSVLGDLRTEQDETLIVRITGVSQGLVGASSARTTILTDDFAPDAVDDSFSVQTDTTLAGNVLAPNPDAPDSDADNDTLSVIALDGVVLTGGSAEKLLTYGTLTIAADGQIAYVPDARADALAPGTVVTEQFEYTISDGNGGIDTASAGISVIAPAVAVDNHAPVATGDTVAVDEDDSVTISVLANDTDSDGDDLAVAAFGQGAHGSVIGGDDDSLIYVPDADFHGEDSFTYTITDGVQTSTATVNVTVNPVNDLPETMDIAASFGEADTITVDLLSTASDIDGDALTVADVSIFGADDRMVSGTVSAAGVLSLDPGQFDDLNDDESLDVMVSYQILDGTDSIPGMAVLTILGEGSAEGPNLIQGTSGRDILKGTDGADEIDFAGGFGDVGIGGGGDDVFVFTANISNGTADSTRIADWSVGDSLSGITFEDVDLSSLRGNSTMIRFAYGPDKDVLTITGDVSDGLSIIFGDMWAV
ncbi:Calx-beta domain-containing protein [Paracoccus sp. (in: a-proteobacteria)]|uniref:Calx-beta domain-containing protein n=1 Tax=Paracoccus sp. TaxID=267 RepID=UPI003A8C8280